ncbi:hypothetical protein Tco_1419101 [Tanacetum coccineum]
MREAYVELQSQGIAPVAIIDRQLPFEYTITSISTDVVVPIPPAPTADSEANVLAEWNAIYDAYNEVACLMLGSMTPELHRQFENYSPFEMLIELKSMFEKQAGVERFDLIQTFHACKQGEGKLVVAYVLKMKGYVEQLERLDYYSEDQYAVSIKKIRRIRACTHQRPQRIKLNTPYPERLNTPYSRYGMNIIFWKISIVVSTPRIPNTPYPIPWIRPEYGVSTSIGYGVSSSLSNTAYSLKLINTAYPLPLDTAYRLSGTEAEILCMTRSSTNELFTPYKEPEREFRSSRRHFKTLSLDELRSPDFNLLSDQEYSEEEEAEAMAETMEQYMSKTRTDYGSGVARPKIEEKDTASHWLRNEPTGSIKTWEDLKTKFLNKYCPPGRTAKKMEEINNFQQEPDETLYQAWERFKELLMKCPQHYLTKLQEVILFYNGLDIPTRQILDSRGAIPSKTAADAKVAIKEMAEYSQKWHNGTSRARSTKTSDGLVAIQAQLNNLGREIKKVNEKVYATQVGCEQCKGPHYTKDCPLKEERKTLEEAYYKQFGGPFQGGGYRATTPGYYKRNNANPSYQERRQSMEDTLSKFMSESAKRHEEKFNLDPKNSI